MQNAVIVKNIILDGDLDLNYTELAVPLFFEEVTFGGALTMMGAHFKGLHFHTCSINGFTADSVQVDGDISIMYGTKSMGGLRLAGAKISKDFFVNDVEINQPNGHAINLNGCKVDGSVVFNTAKLKGELNLIRSAVGGEFTCQNLSIQNTGSGTSGVALIADGAHIDGPVTFFNHVSCTGEMRFYQAHVGGDFFLNGIHIMNEAQRALSLDGIQIQGGLRVVSQSAATKPVASRTQEQQQPVQTEKDMKTEPSVIKGEVVLIRADVAGDVDLSGTHISNPRMIALNADGIKVVGDFSMALNFHADGQVKLEGAAIGNNLFCDAAVFNNPGLVAFNCRGTKVTGAIMMQNGFSIRGTAIFYATSNDSYFVWKDAKDVSTAKLDLRFAKTKTFIDDQKSWPEEILLRGFDYGEIVFAHDDNRLPTLGHPQEGTAAARLKWLKKQPPPVVDPQPFEQLAKSFSRAGYESEAEDIMIAKNSARGEEAAFGTKQWFWYRVLGKFIGYGYRPFTAFLVSLFVIIMGAFFFRAAQKHDLIVPIKDCVYPSDHVPAADQPRWNLPAHYARFHSLAYSFEAFAPLVRFDQCESWGLSEDARMPINFGWKTFEISGRTIRMYLWVHIVLGWVLTSLWVGALTGVTKS